MAFPTRNPDVLLKDMGGETLLYNSGRKEVHIINPTARLVWELCDGEHSLQSIEQSIHNHFSISEEQDIQGDVMRTLDLFRSKGLLQAEG